MSATPPNRKIRILIVEDAIDQAMFLRAMLESTELYEVEWAQDGGRALQMFEDHEFDAVLTDLNLPGMDGFDLTRELKRISKVPIIAVTGYTHQSYFESAYRAGADALLNKPVSQDEVVARLRDLLPDLHPSEADGVRVFALGAFPGDAVAALGGTLARHADDGAEVMIYVLRNPGEEHAAAARSAAELLGARVIVAPPDAPDRTATERQMLLERVVNDFDPHFAYVPSLADDNVDRREAHRLSKEVFPATAKVLGYATATTTLDFRPTAYRDIEMVMPRKIAALDAFGSLLAQRPDLSPLYTQATARWWGRFRKFGEVEPFELISG